MSELLTASLFAFILASFFLIVFLKNKRQTSNVLSKIKSFKIIVYLLLIITLIVVLVIKEIS